MTAPVSKVYLILYDSDKNRIHLKDTFTNEEYRELFDTLSYYTAPPRIPTDTNPSGLPERYPALTNQNDGKNALGLKFKNRNDRDDIPPISQEWLDRFMNKDFPVTLNFMWNRLLKGKSYTFRFEYDA